MIKVAGYCRVSTDKEDQLNSFATQQHYFQQYIEEHPEWSLYKIYADEGITGTSTQKRIQFNRMIRDAFRGEFQLIVTKEVSRFSRNILDTIRYTRELRSFGIGVYFLSDRINTLEPEAEMMLSFLASLAQEESRRTSSRVVWGQTRQMEKGIVFGRSLLGYDVKDGVLSINEEGAEIVRLIFHKYAIEQIGTSEIARYLTQNMYHTARGSTDWKPTTIVRILKNEKYVGDLVQKKSYTPDFLSHEKRVNRGEVPLVRIENHHKAIISRDLWNITQKRLHANNKHSKTVSGHSNRYVYSGKIRCGECGSCFVGRFQYLKDGTRLRRWSCGKATYEGTEGCKIGKLVRDDDAIQMLKTAINSLPMDVNAIIKNITDVAVEAIRMGMIDNKNTLEILKREITDVQRKKLAMMDSYFSKEISREDMVVLKKNYDEKLEELQNRLQKSEKEQRGCLDMEKYTSMITTEVCAILKGETQSDVFYKNVLDSLTVFKDRHMVLRLKQLPQVFWYSG